MAINIGTEIEGRFSKETTTLLKLAGELAAREEQRLYLVGGVVRDLLLGRPSIDLDLVIEGDATRLARRMAQGKGGELVTHPQFGTATLKQGPVRIDLVSARSERYERPGALPTVKPGTIQDDLFRRDFTINAMAVRVDADRFGEMFDPYGGKNDLDLKLIRVLHEGSFRDDPTRMWRAIRYEQRLGFRLEDNTERLLCRDLEMMKKVSGDRLRHELELIFGEECPEKILLRAGQLGALRLLQPSLKADAWLAKRFKQSLALARGSRPDNSVLLALLSWKLTSKEIEKFVSRLNLGSETAGVLRSLPELKGVMAQLASPDLAPSAIYRLLERYPGQAIMAAALTSDTTQVRQRLKAYLTRYRLIKTALDGEDLKKMGVLQGEKMGQVLRALLEARLDGKVTSRKDEEDLVRRLLAESK